MEIPDGEFQPLGSAVERGPPLRLFLDMDRVLGLDGTSDFIKFVYVFWWIKMDTEPFFVGRYPHGFSNSHHP